MTAMPSLRSPHVRIGSPDPGSSTLMTSAPNSAKFVPAIGPAASVAASMTRSPWSGPAPPDTRRDAGPPQAEVIAQRRPGVTLAEHAATLELRDHQPNHVLVCTWHVGCSNDEPVARVPGEPLLHLVRDLRRRPDETRALQQRGPVAGEIGQLD